MTAQMDELEQRLAGGRKIKAPWSPPVLEDFAPGVLVNAWDGSLNNAGYVLAWCTGGEIIVQERGTIRPKTDLTCYLGTWERAIRLRKELTRLHHLAYLADWIAVEAPMVAGGHRTESSLIAGLQVWQWAEHAIGRNQRLDVGATHVSSVLLGDAKVPSEKRKGAIKEAVARYIPGSDSRDWNEHERDAAAIALTVLWDLAHR